MSVPAGGDPPNPDAAASPESTEGGNWWERINWSQMGDNLQFLREQEEERLTRRTEAQAKRRPASPASPQHPENPPSDHPATREGVRVRTDSQPVQAGASTLATETPGDPPPPPQPEAKPKRRATLKLW
jgi:hypothetical protein